MLSDPNESLLSEWEPCCDYNYKTMENNQGQCDKVFISSRKSLTLQKLHVIIRDERFTDLPELHDFLNYPYKLSNNLAILKAFSYNQSSISVKANRFLHI